VKSEIVSLPHRRRQDLAARAGRAPPASEQQTKMPKSGRWQRLRPRTRMQAAMTPTLAAILWFAGLVGWTIIRQPFERRAKKIGVRKSLFDRRESSLLALAIIGMFVIPALYVLTGFPAALDRPFVAWIAWVGLVPEAAALWLFRRSHADLGRNWSISLELREQHALVQSGVYRFIRHPMYTSFFLLGLAQLLLLPNWLAGLAGIAGVGALFGFRVAREERMMLESFGEDYRAYMAHTKRIVPWII
jgi:protein-S-isoprenylcysteine O-methyltransferase Ste14